jgi:hypothetical protein
MADASQTEAYTSGLKVLACRQGIGPVLRINSGESFEAQLRGASAAIEAMQ